MTRETTHPTAVTVLPTPIGELTIAATEHGIAACTTTADPGTTTRRLTEAGLDPTGDQAHEHLDRARTELTEYFAGRRHSFTVPVDLRLASEFDRQVLGGLATVGYGSTTSYGRLGADLGLPAAAVRGLGAALGRNPVWVVVPCHRVIGADGSLTGYAGGLAAKRTLLDLESDLPQLDLGW